MNSRKQIGNSPPSFSEKLRDGLEERGADCGSSQHSQNSPLPWDLEIDAHLEILQHSESKYRALKVMGPTYQDTLTGMGVVKISDLLFPEPPPLHSQPISGLV